MQKNWFIKCVNGVGLFIIIYCIYFIALHFIYPDIGDISIEVNPVSSHLDSKVITITNPAVLDRYYLIIYQDNSEDDWLYFNSSNLTKPDSKVIKLFLPTTQSNYLFFEGSKSKPNLEFKLTSKYPMKYMSSKEHIFHVQYIVPFDFPPFPTFYYSKHYTFFVDPLI